MTFLEAKALVDTQLAPRHVVLGTYCVLGFRQWDATEFFDDCRCCQRIAAGPDLETVLEALGVEVPVPEEAETLWGKVKLGEVA